MRAIIQSIDDKTKSQSHLLYFSNGEYSINTLINSLKYANPNKSFNILKI